MIVYKNKVLIKTISDDDKLRYIVSGWYLFGFIPLYVRKINIDLPTYNI
jgi:hypothetical protein